MRPRSLQQDELPFRPTPELAFFLTGTKILASLAQVIVFFPEDSPEWKAIDTLTASLEMKMPRVKKGPINLNKELQRVCGLLATCFTEIAEAQGERYAQAHPLPEGEPRGN